MKCYLVSIRMRKSKAKQRILETAQKAIRERGYFNLNVNDIAYMAKASVGTLYYHFPKGKTSILVEILSQMQKKAFENNKEWLENQDLLKGSENFDQTLKKLLLIVLQQRRKDKHLLAAVQTEMLADLEQYQNVVELYESHDTMQQGWKIFVDFIVKLSLQFPDESMNIKGHERRIERVIGTLMTYQIMFPDYFGTDSESVEMILGILRIITR